MSFLSFSPSQSLWQGGSSCVGLSCTFIHVGDKNQYFKIICEILLSGFILPEVNGKVEGWAWSNYPFQYKKYVKTYWTYWLCNLTHLFLPCADGNTCDSSAGARGRRCQKGKQSPLSFPLPAYSALPPHPQLLPKELHFCTSGPLILIYSTA